MARKKKGKKPQAEVFGSDDERAYAKEPVPDKAEDDFYYDEVDQFHNDRNKIMLDKGAKLDTGIESSGEEEVLGFDDDTDENDDEIADYEQRLQRFKGQGFKDEMASDVEEESNDEADEEAWGNKKSHYYGDDLDDYDAVESGGSETEAAILEEKEAREIQKRMAEQMVDDDFDLDIFKTTKPAADESSKEVVSRDLTQLSRREKLQLLKNESPELLELVADYKTKMSELHGKWLPIHRLIRAGKLPHSNGSTYIQTKVRLYLNYCVNVGFYVMLKARRTPVTSHPVISRILQYRNLIKEFESADLKIKDEVDKVLQQIESGEAFELPSAHDASMSTIKTNRERKKKKPVDKKKLSALADEDESETEDVSHANPEGGRTWGRKRKNETRDEVDALQYYDMMKRRKTQEEDITSGIDEEMDGQDNFEQLEADDEEGGKRAITYQIEKNKGLTPKRKKEQRNPRVKHRMKYRKANIRRKGQIREVRKELTPYGGELSGIRAGIKKSVKFK